jgi:putative transposase
MVQVLCNPDAHDGQEEAQHQTTNKRRRHTPEQIIRKLAEGNKLLAGGKQLTDVCRHLEIAESS